MKKLCLTLLFLLFFLLLYLVSTFSITGKTINTGNISIAIEGTDRLVIFSPLNTTYNFLNTDPLELNLNVSAEFEVDSWRYSLYNIRHDVFIEQHKSFSPNTTIQVSRGPNRLTVYAKEIDGSWLSKTLVFFVNVSNSAPILGPISDIQICEGSALDYIFNATDVDEDMLYVDNFPKNPFYTSFIGKTDYQTSIFRLFSGTLLKNRKGLHSLTVSVTDSFFSDSKKINISVIEINNPPVMENIGAQTIWTRGENSQFYKQVYVTDVEDGNSFDGNFRFNISFRNQENIFTIDNIYGIIDYTPISTQVGVYFATVCVRDRGIVNVHENISICLPRTANLEVVCDNFTVTVTNENRAPRIIDYSPKNDVNTGGLDKISFFVETYDPDGTIPDINWYVDGVLLKNVEELSEDVFDHVFGCGVYGNHNVSVFVTDGLLNDSMAWNVSVDIVACPVPEPPKGGSGAPGGGATGCMEVWVCEDWEICQSLEHSFKMGKFSHEDFISSREVCNQEGLFDRNCGFQIRKCEDLNQCNNTRYRKEKPKEFQICHFTENPNCFDGIKNCHSGGCEVLVDCGGPCKPCPTCSDGIQNQGEFGIDCGGPCPFECEKEFPIKINWFFILLIFLLVILIIFIIIKIKKIRKYSSPFRKDELNSRV
jgi:hypothetical protein